MTPFSFTHDVFLRVGLYNKSQILDIEDLWWEHEEESEFMKSLFSRMRKEGMIMIKDYKVKIELIDNEINLFIKSLIPYLRETGA